jgi:hypothetical protein
MFVFSLLSTLNILKRFKIIIKKYLNDMIFVEVKKKMMKNHCEKWKRSSKEIKLKSVFLIESVEKNDEKTS